VQRTVRRCCRRLIQCFGLQPLVGQGLEGLRIGLAAGAIESRSVGGGSIERHQAHFRALEARLNGAVAQVRLFCCEIVG
jgi:hypothetical protein